MDLSGFYSTCLQGDVAKAIDKLEASGVGDDETCNLLNQYKKRFLCPETDLETFSEDPWINGVLNCYNDYYRSVLTGCSTEKAEKSLIEGLSGLPGIEGAPDLDGIESCLERIFMGKGYSFLGGVTAPYRGPYIWKTTQKKEFEVVLPTCSKKMIIFFISDFLMLSWAHFATFGKYHAGGWAKPEGLYYVNTDNKGIDTGSDYFQVSFLKHEAQHLSDFEKFPKLGGVDLEYRAKLVELIYYPDPVILLKKFIAESKNDRSLPHSYASFTLIKGLSSSLFGSGFVTDAEKWRALDSGLISGEAHRIFMKNERDLEQYGDSAEDII